MFVFSSEDDVMAKYLSQGLDDGYFQVKLIVFTIIFATVINLLMHLDPF